MHPRIVVIGAGAAGLLAARTLNAAGYHVTVLEATGAIGGRIRTDTDFANFPVELGAEFIHGSNAITRTLVEESGLSVIPVNRMGNLRWGIPALPLGKLSLSERKLIVSLQRDYHALASAPLYGDMSLRDYFAGLGYDSDGLRMADVLLAQTCCASLETLSIADLQREMQVDHAGGLAYDGEARIEQGYAELLRMISRGLTIRLHSPVSDIQRHGGGLTIYAHGEAHMARACILTVPVSVLKKDTIRFDPPLSRAKRDAIHTFRTERATKLIYRFSERLWPDDATYLTGDMDAARWWAPDLGRGDQAIPVISCYVTANRARVFDLMDDYAALRWGLVQLAELLGTSQYQLERHFVAGKRISWAHEPYARGGYAHVPPGAADARVTLAEPESGGLFFAGEATAYDTNPQTVHGAFESGIRAAREADAYLRDIVR
ncbi:MAG: FAD-dependent oxidoreductase [Pleurocapsa minor GSE-CHR-MK-17-07R]|jgi:monoamine oxidase|nr:FAD-dependent oxidoreductase [Pleurocapsa minor GSE-CHR-MK 17-07R]